VDAWALNGAERALLGALERHGVRYLVVGLSAALLEGADVATQDLDLWLARTEPDVLRAAAKDAGGFWISGFGMQPPAFGGEGLERVDLVLAADGLGPFDEEYATARHYEVDGLRIPVLPLERILASKRAAGRPKDLAQIPALEAALAARLATNR
jgi:hypothetical protein